MTIRRIPMCGFVLSAVLVAEPAPAAVELESRTAAAYDSYLERARREFLSRVEGDRPGHVHDVSAGPARGDGILSVPGGLVHHWVGRGLLRGATLERAIAVSKTYSAYSRIYKPIIASRVLSNDGETFHVLMRLKEGEAGITAVLDVRSTIEYVYPSGGRTYTISNAEEIREVQHAGRREEHLLPAGRDSGYLWRANTFTWFVELPDGVYVEMETIGLSRRFPPLLGWLIEPIARRLGRKSVETSLKEFTAAVLSPASSAAVFDALSKAPD